MRAAILRSSAVRSVSGSAAQPLWAARAAPTASATSAADAVWARETIRRGLALSPELRVVLQLTVLDGLNTREAAQLLGIPRGTVKSRLQRARVMMREELA